MLSQTKNACILGLLSILILSSAYAETLKVNCSSDKGLNKISKAIDMLQKSGSAGPNTIVVSGDCKENLVIQSMDNLTLTTSNGASISDRSRGASDVIDINDSRRVAIIGFTINGGASGVGCFGFSLCRLAGNTIQGSSGFGVWVVSSDAGLNGDIVQNHAARGLALVKGSLNAEAITLQGNGDGAIANIHSTLSLSDSTVQGNFNRGVLAMNGSTLRMLNSVVTANASDGIQLQRSSQMSMENFAGASSVTGNGGVGVNVGDLSFAFFDANSNITGNAAGIDVVCNPQFSATRGALNNLSGGITNCVEP